MTLPTLRTDRLVLRALREQDAPDIVAALNNYEISKWLTVVPFPYTRDDADWFIGENLAGRAQARLILCNDALVGLISVGQELGYWLSQAAWGRGFATEAARAVLNDHFDRTDDQVVHSSHFVENVASRNVLTKLGFVDAGPHVHFSKARNDEVPGRRMTLQRTEFDSRT